jgi:hypothetical protein
MARYSDPYARAWARINADLNPELGQLPLRDADEGVGRLTGVVGHAPG